MTPTSNPPTPQSSHTHTESESPSDAQARARVRPRARGRPRPPRTRRAADGVTAVECPMIRFIILPRWAAPRVVARPSLARTAFPFLVRRRSHFRRSRRARGGPAAFLTPGRRKARARQHVVACHAMPLPCGRDGRPWGFPFRPPFASKRMHGSRAARRNQLKGSYVLLTHVETWTTGACKAPPVSPDPQSTACSHGSGTHARSC
jgi:hypothetical protein